MINADTAYKVAVNARGSHLPASWDTTISLTQRQERKFNRIVKVIESEVLHFAAAGEYSMRIDAKTISFWMFPFTLGFNLNERNVFVQALLDMLYVRGYTAIIETKWSQLFGREYNTSRIIIRWGVKG